MAILIWVNPALRLQAITWTNIDLYVTTSLLRSDELKIQECWIKLLLTTNWRVPNGINIHWNWLMVAWSCLPRFTHWPPLDLMVILILQPSAKHQDDIAISNFHKSRWPSVLPYECIWKVVSKISVIVSRTLFCFSLYEPMDFRLR